MLTACVKMPEKQAEVLDIGPNMEGQEGTNILKDRVMMETSIGYYDDKQTQGFNNMYGDFTVEYNINPAGTWKLKAYTYVGERDENYYTYDAQINYTAGVALAFKQEFNSPARRKNRIHKNRKSKNNEQQ